jgi:hypothetical protein
MRRQTQSRRSRLAKPDATQALFLTLILPRVESHGLVAFRHLRCDDARQNAINEMVALAWRWTLRLVQRGKDVTQFPTAIATFAARAVKAGRRLTGQEKAKDVLSPLAQRRHSFSVSKLVEVSTLSGTNPIEEALQDNTVSPVPDQVAFRCDFPRWLASLDERRHRIAEDLMLGERTFDVANKHGLSPARVSQLRREFMEDWQRFCGDGEESAPA